MNWVLKADNSFLIKFYENLLLGKNNNLYSEYLIVNELLKNKIERLISFFFEILKFYIQN